MLAITLLLLVAERTMHIGIFDPAARRRSRSLSALFLVLLPPGRLHHDSAGDGRHQRSHSRFTAASISSGTTSSPLSSIALALLGFLVWGHHLFASGQSNLGNSIFSLLTFSVAIPSAVKVFNWLGTLYKGSIRFTTPMLAAMGFILLFTIGGLTGLFLGALMTDIPLHDTYFVVAHFHYVMMGSIALRVPGRDVSLVPQDVRQDVQRKGRRGSRRFSSSSGLT